MILTKVRFACILFTVLLSFSKTANADSSRLQACPSAKILKEQVVKLWNDPKHPALTDYKVCSDAKQCFEQDCAKKDQAGSVARQGTSNQQDAALKDFRSASRPFIMCAQGSPKGTLLLTHGLGDSPETFQAVAEELRKKGYNIVTVLLAGHGADSVKDNDNPAPQLGLSNTNWLRDVDNGVNLAKQLFGTNNLTIGGFSTGGAVTVEWMQKHSSAGSSPIQKMILFDPALALPDNKCAVLKSDGVVNWLKNFYALAAGYDSGVSNKPYPNRSPIELMYGGAALCDVQSAVNANQTAIDTKTLAFFSGGYSRSGHGTRTIDAEKSQDILCGNPRSGTTGKVSSGNATCTSYSDQGHLQLLSSNDFPGCQFAKKQNIKFSEMMTLTENFLADQSAQTNPIGVEGSSTNKVH